MKTVMEPFQNVIHEAHPCVSYELSLWAPLGNISGPVAACARLKRDISRVILAGGANAWPGGVGCNC